MSTVKKYLSLIKFSHTIFAMPFALIGFFIGLLKNDFGYSVVPGWHFVVNETRQWNLNETVHWEHESQTYYSKDSLLHKLIDSHGNLAIALPYFLLVILCMVFARSAAMAFNRYLDRSFDAKNPRTAIREIPSGILKANSVLLFTIACSILFMVCACLINPLCGMLSPVALFVVLFYSYTKRFTPLCH